MKGVNGFTFFKNYYDAITDPDIDERDGRE